MAYTRIVKKRRVDVFKKSNTKVTPLNKHDRRLPATANDENKIKQQKSRTRPN